ncbi:MAG TPA: methionine adenosyltransferase [Acidimicrobiia bacterium]
MRRSLFTSESVTEGHPDKVADRISDAVLDAMIATDPQSRVACEALVTTGVAIVAGEITSMAQVDLEAVARDSIRASGYDDPALGYSADEVDVEILVHSQSPDIADGVATSIEARAGSSDPLDALGAGDQGIMFGYAVDETPELMPLPIQLAHQLAYQLAQARKEGALDYLRPDGKTQVTVEYENGRALSVARILLSVHHDPSAPTTDLPGDLMVHVVKPVAEPLLDPRTEFVVNPSGRFEIGGPSADTGLTGRKVVMDTYGGTARHGGGAFSGKDPTKVDRSASYAARHVAKCVVAAGLAHRCEFQLSYAIGRARPFSVHLETFGTEQVDPERLESLLMEFFDLRPAAIIDWLDLRRPIYVSTANYGHFGRNEPSFTWESTARASDLARAAAAL